jgi:Phage integrase family
MKGSYEPIRDFKKGYDQATGITTLKLRREKVNYDFVTFLTPEASKAVNDYLSFRGREAKSGKRRHDQVKKQRIFSDNGYLFICRRVPDEYLITKDEELRKLSEKTIMNTYRQLSDDAHKSAGKGVRNIIRSHNMRKYFNSALLNAGADLFFVDYLMGHVIDATRLAYYRADAEKLRDQYSKFVPYLTIQKELNVSESSEFKRIKAEHETLLVEAERHRVERQELQELRKEIEQLKTVEADRIKLREEFKPFLEEDTKRMKAIEEYTHLSYDEAHDFFNVAELEDHLVPESLEYKEHTRKLKTDPEYRRRFNDAVSIDKKRRHDREVKEKMANITERTGRTLDKLLG